MALSYPFQSIAGSTADGPEDVKIFYTYLFIGCLTMNGSLQTPISSFADQAVPCPLVSMVVVLNVLPTNEQRMPRVSTA